MHRLSKRQTLSTTVLFTTTLPWSIIIISQTQLYSVIIIFAVPLCQANIVFLLLLLLFFAQFVLVISNFSSGTSLLPSPTYIKFECFSLYFKSQVLLVDTNTGTPLPFGTLGIHKVLALTVVVGLKKLTVPYIIS